MKFLRTHPLAVFVLANLLVRLPFLEWYSAPMTDELYIMDQTFFGPGRRLPLFPSLIDMVQLVAADRWWAAKFVSMLTGVLTIIPSYYMTRKLSDSKVLPWVVAAMVALSPLVVRWSLRGMTDVPFTLFLTAAIAAAVYWVHEAKSVRLGAFLCFSGLAMLTRPEGIIMLPLVPSMLLVHIWRLRTAGWAKGVTSGLASLWGLIPWGLWIYWRLFINDAAAYQGTVRNNLKRIDLAYLGDISAHFGAYQITTFYILGPLICLGCLLYAVRLIDHFDRVRFWAGLGFLYVLAGTWFIGCVHFFFSIRHLVFIFPMLIVVGMVGVWDLNERWPRSIRVLTAAQGVWSIAVLVIGLWVTKDTFRDIKEGAIAARQDYAGTLRATDFRQRKSGYYFEGKVVPFSERARLKPGERVLLDSFTLSEKGLERAVKDLNRKYQTRVIADVRTRQGQFLADDVSQFVKENGRVRTIMSRLFKWQYFRTVVLEIEGPR